MRQYEVEDRLSNVLGKLGNDLMLGEKKNRKRLCLACILDM